MHPCIDLLLKQYPQAADQCGKAEEAVFEALSEIPRVMENAKRYVARYQQMQDQYLEQRTIDLFQAILVLLCHIMKFFVDRKLSQSQSLESSLYLQC